MPGGLGAGVTWLKLRSGTALVPVVQSADRAFSFVCEMPDPASGKKHQHLRLIGNRWVARSPGLPCPYP
jgi:hypothetical protein